MRQIMIGVAAVLAAGSVEVALASTDVGNARSPVCPFNCMRRSSGAGRSTEAAASGTGVGVTGSLCALPKIGIKRQVAMALHFQICLEARE